MPRRTACDKIAGLIGTREGALYFFQFEEVSDDRGVNDWVHMTRRG